MEKNKRIRYWDIAKGIAIILVIVGHIGSIPPFMRATIFSFHMPLFFIASAFFIKSYDIKNTLKRSARNLLVPYAAVCLISAFIDAGKNADIATNWKILVDRVLDMFAGMSKIQGVCENFHSVWLVWFVICLFLSRIIYVSIMQITKRFPWFVSLQIIFGLSVSGVVLGKKIGFLPWSADVALFAIFFLWVGDHSKFAIDYFRKYKYTSEIILPAVILSGVAWIYLVRKGYYIEMATRRYEGGPLCVLTALLATFVILMISMFLDKYLKYSSALFSWFGKNSLYILIVHCLEMRFFDWGKYIYPHMPCVIDGIWCREIIVKTLFILLISGFLVFIRRITVNLDSAWEKAETESSISMRIRNPG